MAASPPPTLRFVNTFRPVFPLYEKIALHVRDVLGWQMTICESRGQYRGGTAADVPGAIFESIWVPGPLRGNRRWSAIFFWLLVPFHLLRVRRSVNVFLTDPPFLCVLGSWISRWQKTPYIIYVLDLYPELLAAMGLLRRRGLFYRLLARASATSLRHAVCVITLGQCMRETTLGNGVDPKRVFVVPPWPPTVVRPIAPEDNLFRRQHGLGDAFVVMYSGNMGAAHQLQTILTVARRLEGQADLRFVFIGRGKRRAEVVQAIADGASNLLLFDYQDEALLPHSLSAANVHFVSLRSGFEGLVVPSKLISVLATGRPVIYEGAPPGDAARLVEETGAGVVVPVGDADVLEAQILRLHGDRKLAGDMGARARAAFEARFGAELGGAAVADVLDQALGDVRTGLLQQRRIEVMHQTPARWLRRP